MAANGSGLAADGFGSNYIFRPISKYLVKYYIHLDIPFTPNQLTWLSFLLAILSGFCYYYSYIIFATIILFVSEIIDHLDGEVARVCKISSDYGAYLDRTLDRYADAAILIGITLGIYNFTNDYSIIVIGMVAMIGSYMTSYTAITHDLYRSLNNASSILRIGRDTRIIIIIIGSLLNYLDIALYILCVVMNFESFRRIIKSNDRM